MEACFNELSLTPICSCPEEVRERVGRYVKVIETACKNHGLKKVRYEQGLNTLSMTPNSSLADYCYSNRRDKEVQLLLSTQRYPYVSDTDADAEDKYIASNVFWMNDEKEIKAEGFTAAYALGLVCVGFCPQTCWESVTQTIKIKEGNDERCVQWICISDECHWNTEEYRKWHEENIPLILMESELEVGKKKISLRDDHGKDVLEAHAKRLLLSPYVIGIINSLPYQSHERRYIRKVYDNGLIEIVLTYTDKGLGMVIQTTGRNLRETRRIAEILSEKYGC